MNIELNSINEKFHTEEFREQTAVLHLIDFEDSMAVFLRSFVAVGSPGATGFDPNSSGFGNREGWEHFHDLYSNQKVRGTYHTHPQGLNVFSSQDVTTQNAFARALGDAHLWHVVQDVGNPMAQVVCVTVSNGIVIRHNLCEIESSPYSKIIRLPLPVKVIHNKGVIDVPYV